MTLLRCRAASPDVLSDESEITMYLLTLTLALAVGAPGEAPAERAVEPIVSPYNPQNLPWLYPLPPWVSPYGVIRYETSIIGTPTALPWMLPAVPVLRSTPSSKSSGPEPVTLPEDGFIPPPRPLIPLSIGQ